VLGWCHAAPTFGARICGGFQALQKAEAERWWPLIKSANIKVD
jgi:hypothetical protein